MHGELQQLNIVKIVHGYRHTNAVSLFGIYIGSNNLEAGEWRRWRCTGTTRDACTIGTASSAIENRIIEHLITRRIDYFNRCIGNISGHIHRRNTISQYREPDAHQRHVGTRYRISIGKIERTGEPGNFDNARCRVRGREQVCIARQNRIGN